MAPSANKLNLIDLSQLPEADFYYLALSGGADGLAVNLAWAYVLLRVVHSFVQSLGNKVMLRFPVFALSSIVLIVMTVRALMAL